MMKTICTEQHLHAISGGTAIAYSWVTGTTAAAGGILGGFTGLAVAAGGRAPSLLAIVAQPVIGGFAGAVLGHAAGAVFYTIGDNFGAIVSAPFKIINFVFQPSN